MTNFVSFFFSNTFMKCYKFSSKHCLCYPLCLSIFIWLKYFLRFHFWLMLHTAFLQFVVKLHCAGSKCHLIFTLFSSRPNCFSIKIKKIKYFILLSFISSQIPFLSHSLSLFSKEFLSTSFCRASLQAKKNPSIFWPLRKFFSSYLKNNLIKYSVPCWWGFLSVLTMYFYYY